MSNNKGKQTKTRLISMKKGKVIIFSILIYMLIGGIFLISCELKGNGLGLDIDKDKIKGSEDTEAEKSEDASQTQTIEDAEFFLELKNRQKNKNPLSDIRVRKAIFYAIDRERIIKELLGGYGKVLNSLFLKDSMYYFPAWKEYSHNLDKAKSFLSDAGYGVDNPLYITIGASDDSNSRKIIEEFIKEDLKKIGINIWIFNKSPREWYLEYIKKGDYELGVWALYTNEGGRLENYFCSDKIPPRETSDNKDCYNFYWYEREEVDQYLQGFYEEGDIERKKELIRDLQEKLAGDAVILPLYSRLFSVAYNKKIKNVDIDLRDNLFFKNIEDWDIEYSGDTDEEDKNMIVGYKQEPYTLNPLILDSIYTGYINNLIIKGLWEKNEEGEYKPVLVEEQLSSGGESDVERTLKVKIKLKDYIYWSDGTPITSEDIECTFKSIMEDTDATDIFKDYKNIKEIEVINEKEFSIVFRDYYDDWRGLFSIIFPKSIMEKDEKISGLFKSDIIGCGPYKLKEWVKGEYILLERNEYYFGEQPKIDSIKFLFDSDINHLIDMLKEGEIDILSIPVDLELMKNLEENKDINLLVKEGNLWEHLALCLKPKEE